MLLISVVAFLRDFDYGIGGQFHEVSIDDEPTVK